MGAWGIGNFENDDALDWLGDFADEPSEQSLRDVIAAVNEADDDCLESSESSSALAAAEIVAALKGFPSFDLPENTKQYVGTSNFRPDDKLILDSLKAVTKIKSDSELKDLWAETSDFSDWNRVVDDLITRLKA